MRSERHNQKLLKESHEDLDNAIDHMLAQPGVQYAGIGYTAYTRSDVESHGVPTYSIIWW